MSDIEVGGEAAKGRAADESLHGVLIVDKPAGPTSHDIVAKLRRVLRTRAIGHAGTLDPAATGVLVVAVGEATKLTPYLTAHEKSYLATVSFGRATTTLDAEGEVTDEAPLPDLLASELSRITRGEAVQGALERALDHERARTTQIPPAFSAIKLKGRPVHERARSGEIVELAPRAVAARSIEIQGAEANQLMIRLHVSKGYYVRSFARDLGETLGVPAHLAALRRTASGPFSLENAIDPASSRETLLAAMIPLADAACRALPSARLSQAGVERARHGKRLGPDDFLSHPPSECSAWLSPEGTLVAIGGPEGEEGRLAVRRGFARIPRSPHLQLGNSQPTR